MGEVTSLGHGDSEVVNLGSTVPQGKSASTVSIPVHMTQESVASEKSSLPKDSSVASGRSRSSQ